MLNTYFNSQKKHYWKNIYFPEFFGTTILLFFYSFSQFSINVGDVLVISILLCTLYTILALFFGKKSGAHFNSTISLLMLLNGRITAKEFWIYVFAQFSGGIISTIGLYILYIVGFINNIGGNDYFASTSQHYASIVAIEIFLVILISLVILNVTTKDSQYEKFDFIIIGVVFLISCIITFPIDGGYSINIVKNICNGLSQSLITGNLKLVLSSVVMVFTSLAGACVAILINNIIRRKNEKKN